MISVSEIKRGFISRIKHARFIDNVREAERSMIGFYTQKEITELTREKRSKLESSVNNKQKLMIVDFTRTELDGVFEKLNRFEAVVIIDGEIISLGCHKTAEIAHAACIKRIEVGVEPKKNYIGDKNMREDKFLSDLKLKSLSNHRIFSA